MDIQLIVTGGPDSEKRFNVFLDGKDIGELQTSREQVTRLADLLFKGHYKLTKN